ncbi:preprotein translocase subunit YajC [Tenacibaculum sp. SG-28]|uniref:preprotein translocase subunit YajC n=1 Tax=Tenacibaculum sp. SG-28 TaxID=754426 RepID=UPI000CF4EAC1|nr:preprotein translocase subunit YajC [Tenacibaculum sp. SG-28]PQJ20752.1 preprotein translocase subunit YajC [Tenacibaculum sp. SG-28]
MQTIFLQAGGILDFAPFILMLGVLYFFMIRPQMKRQKKEKEFQSSIKKGTKVITSSGIHGKIVEINDNDNTITLETGAGKIKFERSAISLD